jgi:hypothetical protein
MRLFAAPLLWMVTFGVCFPALAEQINVGDTLSARMNKDFPPPGCVGSGYGRLCAWTVSDIVVTAVRVDYSNVKPSAIPVQVHTADLLQNNCTDGSLDIAEKTLEVAYEVGEKIMLTNSFVDDAAIEALEIPLIQQSVGLSTVTGTAAAEQDHRRTEKTTQVIRNLSVPAHTQRTFILAERVSTGYLEFRGKVQVDANLRAIPVVGAKDPDRGVFGRLSDKYKDEEQRTFEITGNVWNATAEGSTFTFNDRPLAGSDPLCQSGSVR